VLTRLRPAVERLARLRPLHVLAQAPDVGGGTGGDAIVVLAGGFEARVSRTGTSGGPGRARLERELTEATEALARAEGRLADPRFSSRAPAAVVEGTRQRIAELRERVERLRATVE
jgi:valyl-tRNA synthetase